MKILKNKKALSSVAAILVALALIAGSTMAWFVVNGDVATGILDVGNLKLEISIPGIEDDIFAQPGLMYGGSAGMYGFNNVPLRKDDYPDLQDDLGLNDDDFSGWLDENIGYIKNIGNLPIMVRLGGPDAMTVTRYWYVNYGAGNVFPLDETNWEDAQWLAPGYPGAPGAVLLNIAVPPTPDNILALQSTQAAFYQEEDGSGNVLGTYLYLEPEAKLHIGLEVDMKTNSSDADRFNPAPTYLDNSYMDCKINIALDYLATQGSEATSAAWVDIFGVDLDNFGIYDFLIPFGMIPNPAFDIGLPAGPTNPIMIPNPDGGTFTDIQYLQLVQ